MGSGREVRQLREGELCEGGEFSKDTGWSIYHKVRVNAGSKDFYMQQE